VLNKVPSWGGPLDRGRHVGLPSGTPFSWRRSPPVSDLRFFRPLPPRPFRGDLLRWQKEPEFDKAYGAARRAAFSQAIATILNRLRKLEEGLHPVETEAGRREREADLANMMEEPRSLAPRGSG
jgi:hypothetical protein